MSSNKALNILHFPIWYPNKKSLSQGIFIQRHINAISLMHKCCVLFVTSNTENKNEIEVNVINENFSEVRVYFKKPFSGLLNFMNFIFLANAYFIGLKKVKSVLPKVDIFHHHIFDKKIIISFLLSKINKKKFVFSEQWSGYYPQDGRFNGNLNKLISKICISGSNAITTVSQSLANAMQKHLIDGYFTVIPNVVNVNEFYPLDTKVKVERKLNALHVSAINDKEKNISGMLRAVKNVVEKFPDFRLNIIGEHTERNKLENYSIELGLERNVFFLGYVPFNQLLYYYHKADFFLLFSYFETFSCVLAEALCSGIPVIATNAGGIPEFVNSKNGILVEPANELELQNALVSMIQNRIDYSTQELSNSVINYVSPKSVAEKFNFVYSKILND
jgi:glycosyltransferase involved in cell wall biosynthesis